MTFSYLRSLLSLKLLDAALFIAPKDEKTSLAAAFHQHAKRVLEGQKYQ